MQLLRLFIATDNDKLPGLQRLQRQLPSSIDIVCQAQLVTSQINGRRPTIVQLYPRIGKIVQVVHDTVDVRLHQFIDAQLAFLLAIVLQRCLDQIDASNDDRSRLTGL